MSYVTAALDRALEDKAAGWIEWHGGECPVDPKTIVRVLLRDGFSRSGFASRFFWTPRARSDDDIVAYRAAVPITPTTSPVVAPGATTLDERPGDYIDTCTYRTPDGYGDVTHACEPSRYPDATRADLVTMWRRNGATVMSVTADGKVHDYELPAHLVASLGREAVDVLHRAAR